MNPRFGKRERRQARRRDDVPERLHRRARRAHQLSRINRLRAERHSRPDRPTVTA